MVLVDKEKEFRQFVYRIGKAELIDIVNLADFSVAIGKHLRGSQKFNLLVFYEKIKKYNIKFSDYLNVCKLCDFYNYNNKDYRFIQSENVSLLSYNYLSCLSKNAFHHSLELKSNFIDLHKIIQFIFGNCNINFVVDSPVLIDNLSFKRVEISGDLMDYVNTKEQSFAFYGDETKLEKLVEILENISSKFCSLFENWFLFSSLKLVLSLISKDMKRIPVINLTRNKSLLLFFEQAKVYTVSQLGRINYATINNAVLKDLANVFIKSDFVSPIRMQEKIYNSLKDRDRDYFLLRFKNGLRYNEIGKQLNISRSGAQAALTKLKEKIFLSSRFGYLKRLFKQVLLFRSNDYYITSGDIKELGIWENLLVEMFELFNYKNDGIYIIDGYVYGSEVCCDTIIPMFDEYEFEFIKTLPSIIKKADVGNYVEMIVENSQKNISNICVNLIINLNYYDYLSIISKSKLHITYFLKHILKTFYYDGVDVYNPKNLKDIRIYLNKLFNIPIEEYNDRYLISNICKVSVLKDRGVWKYNDSNIELPPEIIGKIQDYIKNFPISAIPIKTIYEAFYNDLIQFGIDNKYCFQGVVKNVLKEYKQTKDYIFTDDSQTFIELIIDFIKHSKVLVTKDVLEKKFPGFNVNMMQRVCNTSSILNMNGYYVCINNLNISSSDINLIRDDLNDILIDNKPHNVKNIFYKLRNKFNGLFNRVGINHYLQLYYILNKIFDEEFEFSRPFIAHKGIYIQDKETQLMDLIVEEKIVSFDRLKELASKVGYFIDSFMDLVIRNNDRIVFIDNESVGSIDSVLVEDSTLTNIDTVMDNYMATSSYKNLIDIVSNAEFRDFLPNANIWFLYSIISAYSVKYKVVRTSNMMSKTDLILVREGFDFDVEQYIHREKTIDINLEDLLDIEDLY